MSEELIQRNLIEAPEKMGDWNFYNIGATTLKALKGGSSVECVGGRFAENQP